MVDFRDTLAEIPVAVVGFAKTGQAVADFLHREGAHVLVSEARDAAELKTEMQTIKELSHAYEVGEHTAAFLSRAELVIVSPGVSMDLPVLQEIRSRGIKLISELELAYLRRDRGEIIAVSGTNGKSTTTALLGHMLNHIGKRTIACGNIGTPFIQAVVASDPPDYYVVEVSSFQLEGVERFHPHIAILLNVSPDHLDRYATLEAYRDTKLRLFANQDIEDLAILNADDPFVWGARETVQASWLAFSSRGPVERGIYYDGGQLLLVDGSEPRPIVGANELALHEFPGIHNVMAAALAVLHCGVEQETLLDTLQEFQGLPHRLQHVRTVQGIQFYDDSKATNVAATAHALEAFDRGVTLILGGRDKGGDFRQLRSLLRQRVKRVVLIGEAAALIEQQIGDGVEMLHCGTVEEAVRWSARNSEAGDIVLLAPGCASFDQFRDYAHRGEVFQEAVRQWAEEFEEHSILAS